jgi:hypothetical protein
MALEGLTARYQLTPWWLRVLIVFVLSRIVTTSILLYYASIQLKNPWTGAAPDYLDFATIWDGHWYYIISVVGYPSVLPLTADGHIGESAWAFMPAYPSLVRVFTLATGLDFAPVAVAISVAFALGTALLFYKLMLRFVDSSTALFSVVLFCFAPLSPILQVAYAESMQTFFLALALYLLVTRHYWLLLPVVGVMALTRPSGLAFALALALHVGWRLWHRATEEFPLRERMAAITATLFSGAMGLAWLLIAWAVTGSATAYTDTELAWRAGYIGYTELVPFASWIHGAQFWLRFPLGWAIVMAGVAFILGFTALLFTRYGKRLGPDLRFWLVSYLAYLLAVFFPQSSTFRLLVPLFPALGIIAQPKHPAFRIALVLFFIAAQVIWVQLTWFVDGSDWTPP